MRKGDIVDLSDYAILRHCRKRWRKRFLKYTPINSKRIIDIEEIIKTGEFRIIREYPERGTVRVTDKRYEFVIHPEDKVIITTNAYKRKLSKKEYVELKNRCLAIDSLRQINKDIKWRDSQ